MNKMKEKHKDKLNQFKAILPKEHLYLLLMEEVEELYKLREEYWREIFIMLGKALIKDVRCYAYN